MKYILYLLLCTGLALSANAQHFQPDAQLMTRMIEDTSFAIASGVQETNVYYLNKAGKPMAVYIIRVKVKKHKLGLEATTPFNRDTFCRQTMMEQIKWEQGPNHRVIAAINADFFNMTNGEPQEMVIKEGQILKDTILRQRGFVGVLKNGKVIIGDSLLYARKKNKLKEALGGYNMLVKNNRIIPQKHNSFSLTRHPRTALGIKNKREVFLVVVDGRQPEYSNGMPLDELAHLMKLLGAKTAINLDGGGSSTLISTDASTGEWINRNKPSGKVERAVANGWIVVDYR